MSQTNTLQMTNNNLKYLIAGTGGVGGSIAGFLALAGKDVTCIARGEPCRYTRVRPAVTFRLKRRANPEDTRLYSGGIRRSRFLVSRLQGRRYLRMRQRLFRRLLIKRAAHKDTVVIPILNVYGTGPRIQRLVPGVTVLDGCIYIVGFVSGKGEITQMGKIFRLVYGAHKDTVVSRETLEAIQQDLQESGIKAEISPDINRDTFVKWSFISAMAVTGAYYDVPMGEVQKPGKVRDTFIGLSQESAALGRKLGIDFKEDIVEYNLKVIDKLAPESTASMQKDMARGHQSEVQGLLFDMITAAEEQGIDIPTYRMVAEKFK